MNLTKGKIRILQGDVATIDLDAIVNAATESLLGGGVDGAVPIFLNESQTFVGCKNGQAKITNRYNLKQYLQLTL